jgi:heptosyltransferase-1
VNKSHGSVTLHDNVNAIDGPGVTNGAPRILLVKTSSLGDVVHNLPVVGDIRRHLPGASIDWAVEEPFTPIPTLHPGVRRVIPVAVRRWRRTLLAADTRREFAQYRRAVHEERYDAVIDTQGLIKSALLARAAALATAGCRHGMDAASARERLAARFYTVRHAVPRGLHAVTRNRLLAAQALGYALDDAPPDYGIRVAASPDVAPPGRYGVLLHATAGAHKAWPEASWIALGQRLAAQGLASVLPWGHREEHERALRIAAAVPRAVVPPHMPLDRVMGLLAGASAVIGVDTGLLHLAVALGRPVVGVYTGTDPAATGAFGSPLAVNLGKRGGMPTVEEVMQALADVDRMTDSNR